MTFDGFPVPTKNFFHMPNNWTDITAGIRNLAELKVVEYVARHTWGYQEYGISKAISTDEFMYGRRRKDGSRMDKGTGLSNRSVIDGLRAAEEHGYLLSDTDVSDKARIVKSYMLHMYEGSSPYEGSSHDEDVSPSYEGSSHQGEDTSHLAEGSSHRTEKDTIERHYRKTRKKDTSTAQNAVAFAQRSQQGDDDGSGASDNTILAGVVDNGSHGAVASVGDHGVIRAGDQPEKDAISEDGADLHKTKPSARTAKPKAEVAKPSGPPLMPDANAAWNTRKCLAWFDYWRGAPLIGKFKLMQAATCAKGLADNYSEEQVLSIREDMLADPYWIAQGGCDVCNVANNITKYLRLREARKRGIVTPSQQSTKQQPRKSGVNYTRATDPTVSAKDIENEFYHQEETYAMYGWDKKIAELEAEIAAEEMAVR